MKILKDNKGNLFRAQIIHSVPEGFTVVDAVCPDSLKDVDINLLEVYTVQETSSKPAYQSLRKKTTADIILRNKKLDKLRELRKPLLIQVDIEINILEDQGLDSTAMREYRQALRDITKQYVKVNGDPKVSVDSIDLANYSWPTKP